MHVISRSKTRGERLLSLFSSKHDVTTKSKMRNYLGICLVSCFALFGLGSAIQCINCIDYTGSCTSTKHCNLEDACLTLKERGGDTYRQCIKYNDCNQDQLTQMFPSISKFNFQCCTSNLCNGATSIGPGKHLLGLFASLAVMWWCMH
ncbi:CD59 molecule (CD59 blood group) [Esox lucius]|uniref:MAC-inhibitory protein n=1 Tax=Esox lucius TaxID=8010 RepID=C1BY21_ESOLU|nr:CD59 glycoprotein [Esox lucius]ACO13924.1 CD59 glycoprotein precursor [Esox lucius]